MTEQNRAEALKYIESQLEDGYIDLGLHDEDELEIVKEAIQMLKIIDKFNNIGCTSFMFMPEKDKPIKIECDDGCIDSVDDKKVIRVNQDLSTSIIKASNLGILDCNHVSDEEFEEIYKELATEYESN